MSKIEVEEHAGVVHDNLDWLISFIEQSGMWGAIDSHPDMKHILGMDSGTELIRAKFPSVEKALTYFNVLIESVCDIVGDMNDGEAKKEYESDYGYGDDEYFNL